MESAARIDIDPSEIHKIRMPYPVEKRHTADRIANSSSEAVPADDQKAAAMHEFIAGCAAGSVSIFVGHPFDTIKVRMQTSMDTTSTSRSKEARHRGTPNIPKPTMSAPRTSRFSRAKFSTSTGFPISFTGYANAFQVRHPSQPVPSSLALRVSPHISSFLSLYRGITAPLSTTAAVNAIKFASFGAATRIWEDTFERDAATNPPRSDALKVFTCGCFSGAVKTLVMCPMEHVKCRLQVETGSSARGVLARIVKNHGPFQGLYRGFVPTFLRESPSMGIYFATYYITKPLLEAKFGTTDEHGAPSPVRSFAACSLAGALSGVTAWTAIYPVDVIKSRMQTSSIRGDTWQVGAEMVAVHGWKSLYRGLGITLVRALPVNGILFPVYEFVLGQLRSDVV